MLKSYLDNTKSILLLDGIDRINNNNVFVALKDCFMDIKNKHLNVKILITCRFHDYKTNRNIIMPGFTVHTIAPLNEEQKALMIKNGTMH